MTLLRTSRLELQALGLEAARLQVHDRAAFFRRLDVPAPSSWPPPLNDEESMQYWLRMLEADPASGRWAEYAFIATTPRRLVGNGGFKGAPRDGAVEIGYSILPDEQGKGFATEAARTLVTYARAQGVTRVLAHTLVDGLESQNVLRKCGFSPNGATPEPGVVGWELSS